MVDTAATEDTAATAVMEDTVMAMEVMVMALDTMAATDMAATATDMVAETNTATITTVIVAAPTLLTLTPLMITARLHPPALLLRLHELTNSDRTRVLNHTTIAENRSVRPIK